VQDRHHAGPHPQAGQGRHRVALRHADLRSRAQTTQPASARATCIGIGGDPINGTSFIDALKLFQDDPQTEAIIMVGEIGGTAEEEAAEFIAEPTSPSRWSATSPA
jgi:hypothetical protein